MRDIEKLEQAKQWLDDRGEDPHDNPNIDRDIVAQWLVDFHEAMQANEDLGSVNGMPSSLTAENGAKDLLIGEFFECFDPDDCGNPYVVPISWDSIKKIYKNSITFNYYLMFMRVNLKIRRVIKLDIFFKKMIVFTNKKKNFSLIKTS